MIRFAKGHGALHAYATVDTSLPHARLFGPTYGLDHRLFIGEKLRPEIRDAVLAKFNRFCTHHGWDGWRHWAKVVFFGSEASTWTSATLEGNADFDLSIGLHYARLRKDVPRFAHAEDTEIAHDVTELLHAELNDPDTHFTTAEGTTGPWDQTWFANTLGYTIAKMRPYAALDVHSGRWIVRPPHLPDWDIHSFPQGEGLVTEMKGIAEMARGVLAMPEPYRTQQGSQLWEYIHSNRSKAFGDQGEGWWDASNAIEKFLDQLGLMQPLWTLHQRSIDDPKSLDAPKDWSNDPTQMKDYRAPGHASSR